ncbi:cytochrome c-type biogenesis protein [Rouxiella badensis]|jgi:cytochrome c-type biogenesis protein CcmH|uniref:Cytochrome c-type biogenesis protein n=1 Tax=Rouxiella badensis TaxID=1646377 RepID=A0A1X0WCD0_9GAMM|nr:cytochrome c-type biogenesis protein [Rouxiella badensis]MCC3703065.1 cytochrome c-type biogenesis protein CcmH [Rouxiella badensis]MCC3721194.1 cytochrome c-type biogenesis protein CcmH [Rouxiella badensis]MCC3730911.1 cytochrome c-type biogenesis protein CcmH [Rouxiella badensis]MCC3742431.1 cytochrome c-type biogenesis protein CcmH [Rouxiella badensis]MCC3747672.1 cytochrome c-type biogenesis protein CcmH [Rouxiella badensis]
MRLISLIFGLMLSFSVFAAIDAYQFKSPQQEQQYRELTEQLRCPKCQNTNIAASDSIIAADMRKKVLELLNQGQSSKQIVDYMVARYGNFVTYEPPVTPSTLILWVGPALFVIVGALVIILRARRRQTEEQMSSQEKLRLAQLLGEKDRKES